MRTSPTPDASTTTTVKFPIAFSLTPGEVIGAIERPRHVLMRWDWIGSCAMTFWGAGILAVSALSLLSRTPSLPAWKAVFGLALGAGAVGHFGIAPLIGALRTRRVGAGPITVTIDDDGIRTAFASGATIVHPWVQVTGVHRVGGGVLIDLMDGGACWILRRAFASVRELSAFACTLTRMLPSLRRGSPA